MSDDLFSQLHERLTDEYLEAHPGITWTAAYNMTSIMAYEQWRLMEEELNRGQDQ